jgi:putative flippase GtrA
MKVFSKFIIVGGLGFITDLAVLTLLIYWGSGPLVSRAFSFSVAVLVTFFLNRSFTFQNSENIVKQFSTYIGASFAGLSVNWISYILGLNYLPAQIALAAGSVAAMLVNYLLYKFFVFSR